MKQEALSFAVERNSVQCLNAVIGVSCSGCELEGFTTPALCKELSHDVTTSAFSFDFSRCALELSFPQTRRYSPQPTYCKADSHLRQLDVSFRCRQPWYRYGLPSAAFSGRL